MENIENTEKVVVTYYTEKQRLSREVGPMKKYFVGDKVVFRHDGVNQIAMITNIRTHKGKRVGYDIRSEKGSGFIIVPVDNAKANPSIDSVLTEIWVNNGGTNNMFVDRSIGHTTANFGADVELDDLRHFEKNNDFVFKTIGPRSY